MLENIGDLLEDDRTLGGNLYGMIYGRPETSTEPVVGAPTIKFAILLLTVDYEAAEPLA